MARRKVAAVQPSWGGGRDGDGDERLFRTNNGPLVCTISCNYLM
jgi:hypothetical protein